MIKCVIDNLPKMFSQKIDWCWQNIPDKYEHKTAGIQEQDGQGLPRFLH